MSGKSDPYTDADALALMAALEDTGFEGGAASIVEVMAAVEWQNDKKDKVRPVRFRAADLRPVRAALDRAAADVARPAASYGAKSLRAQVGHLLETRAGRARLAELPVSVGRIVAWSEGAGARKGNRELVEQAYQAQALAAGGGGPERNRVEHAHAVADALTQALKDAEGNDIRIRDIAHINISLDQY